VTHPPFLDPTRRLPLTAQGTFEALPDLRPLWDAWSALGPALWLDSGGPISESSRWIVLAGKPTERFQGTGSSGEHLDASGASTPMTLEGFLGSFGTLGPPFIPPPEAFARAWFGGFTYECGVDRLGLPTHRSQAPDAFFFLPASLVVLDRVERQWRFYGDVDSWTPSTEGAKITSREFHSGPLRSRDGKSPYEEGVRKVLRAIAAGDLYQANLSQSFEAVWSGSPCALFEKLRALNPGPFMALFRGPGFTVVSSSPERLVQALGARLDARPIAGTRPRGRTPEEDLRLREELTGSPKERAEHVMMVDLARNDLGRVSDYGSVHVSDFARVEPYARVQHLVSTVEGRLREDETPLGILDSLFPGGTITGCPKRHCVEILNDLEPRPRGYYTGSLGYVAPGPVLDWNILIRTFTLWDGGPLEFHAGAGIVADSDPGLEYEETLHKVQALAESLGTTLI